MAIEEKLVDESQTPQKLEHAANAGFLWDFWYPAARSAEIRGRGLAKAMLLEVPLVLGRTDDGAAFALRMHVRTVGFRFLMAGLTGRACSAAITGGSLTGAAGSAWRFLR